MTDVRVCRCLKYRRKFLEGFLSVGICQFCLFQVVTPCEWLDFWGQFDKQLKFLILISGVVTEQVYLMRLLDSKSFGSSRILALWWIYFLWGRFAAKVLTKPLPGIFAGFCHEPSLLLWEISTYNQLESRSCRVALAIAYTRFVRRTRLFLSCNVL